MLLNSARRRALRASLTLVVLPATACVDSTSSAGDDAGAPAPAEHSVSVDLDQQLAVVAPYAYGMHSSVYDNALHDEQLPSLLTDAGIALLRYPGGGYSDNYHWSTHTMTPWFADDGLPIDSGYLAESSDFGSFVSVLESFGGAAMITVNYGSNPSSDGPGEPNEAAAWVAYANGLADDETAIGADSTGYDWQTVGFWASLRGAEPLDADDGRNFLRIAHPEPLGIEYWEIGNEVFGNGYYGGRSFELDLHAPYGSGVARDGNEALSPSAYGRGVVEYIQAMKRVDPTIKVGAVLVTPPMDYSWAPEWNDAVLTECGEQIDFGIVHWYEGDSPSSLIHAPRTILAEMREELTLALAEHGGDDAERIELTMTELGPDFPVASEQAQATGIFAADVHLTAIEQGFVNLDWLELHNGSFLSERSERLGPAYKGIQMAHHVAEPGDALVRATSSREDQLVAHAADRADGSVGLMLVNLSPTVSATVTVQIDGRSLASTGQVYEYHPEGAAADGSVVGPEVRSDLGNSFSVELPPYGVTDVIVPAAD